MARRQGAKSWEVRATTSLGKLTAALSHLSPCVMSGEVSVAVQRLAHARDIASMQRGKRADGRVQRGNPVDYRWPTRTGGSFSEPVSNITPAIAWPIGSNARRFRNGPYWPKPENIDHDHAGIRLFQDIVTQPHPLHPSRPG